MIYEKVTTPISRSGKSTPNKGEELTTPASQEKEKPLVSKKVDKNTSIKDVLNKNSVSELIKSVPNATEVNAQDVATSD